MQCKIDFFRLFDFTIAVDVNCKYGIVGRCPADIFLKPVAIQIIEGLAVFNINEFDPIAIQIQNDGFAISLNPNRADNDFCVWRV